MRGTSLLSRRAADIAVVAVVYALTLIGAFALVSTTLATSEGFPDLRSGASALLVALLPAALLVTMAVAAFRFAKDYRRRAWGYRLRGRLILWFVVVALMGSVPATVFYGRLATIAAGLPVSASVREALDGGLSLALSYYEKSDESLRYVASNDVAPLVATRGADAARVLGRLSARDPDIRAVELFADGRSVSFAGDEAMRSPGGAAPAEADGFLPRLSSGGEGYARYFARDAGAAPDGRRLSAAVSLRYPARIEDAAARMTSAKAAVESAGRLADSFPGYLGFFWACILFPLLVLAVLFGMASADMVLRPVAALDDALARVKKGERRALFMAKPGDEAGALIESLNAVLDGMERSRGDELRNEKLEAWRDIARKLAHELKNPLTPIRLSAERVLRRWKNDPSAIGEVLEKSMVAIVQETANMDALLTEFRDFARLPEPQKDWMALAPMVEEIIHLYSASWPGVVMDASNIDPGIVLKADRGYLKQALGNLIANAADAMAGAGHVWIRADLVKTAESRYCRIQVRDDGAGIPADIQDKVFTPYFTTKSGGTGLGLAIVEHIVAAHGGRIRFDSAEGSGTVFYIDLPAESEYQER